MLLQPNKKTVKKLREVLYELYKHLDSSAAAIIDVSTWRLSRRKALLHECALKRAARVCMTQAASVP